MKLELKDSGDILREFWIAKVLTGLFNFWKFFCSECLEKYGSVRFGLDPAPVFRRCQLLSLKPQWFTQ